MTIPAGHPPATPSATGSLPRPAIPVLLLPRPALVSRLRGPARLAHSQAAHFAALESCYLRPLLVCLAPTATGPLAAPDRTLMVETPGAPLGFTVAPGEAMSPLCLTTYTPGRATKHTFPQGR